MMSLDTRRRARHEARVRQRYVRHTPDEVGGAWSERRGWQPRWGHKTHGGAHDTVRACVNDKIGTRRTRSAAALDRHDDSLAARFSLGVDGTGSNRAEPTMQRERRAGVMMSLDTRRRLRHAALMRQRNDRHLLD